MIQQQLCRTQEQLDAALARVCIVHATEHEGQLGWYHHHAAVARAAGAIQLALPVK